MTCHICSSELEYMRSVLIRPWLPEYDEWDSTKDPPKWDTPAYQQYQKNMQFRRAFICEKCYQKIDAHPVGLTEIPGFGRWNLAGKSRGGMAVKYDLAKWQAFQRSKAKAMGIEL